MCFASCHASTHVHTHMYEVHMEMVVGKMIVDVSPDLLFRHTKFVIDHLQASWDFFCICPL